MTWPDDYIDRVIQGDCLEVMKGIPDDSIDFVFADPPYNVGKLYDIYDDNMPINEYINWCRNWYIESMRITKTCIAITPGIISIGHWIANIKKTHYIIAWTKQNNCGRNYIGIKSGFQTWEPILIYGKAKKTIIRDSIEIPISIQSDVGNHPCPKPLKLLTWIIEQFSNKGDLILDPFLGSGTTAVACINTNRRFIGIELDPQYCTIAEKRIKQARIDKAEADRQLDMF